MKTCPRCGHELVFKYGAYGQFIGCSNYPTCFFTMNADGTPTQRKKEVDEWDEDGNPTGYVYAPIIKTKTQKKCPYNSCDSSGLLPFIKPDGTISKHAKIFCECHEDEPEHYHEVKSDDFDFPMSYDVYRGLCQEHGWPDPGPDRPEETEPEITPVFRPRLVDKEIDQLKGGFIHLQNKLNTYIETSKRKKGKY